MTATKHTASTETKSVTAEKQNSSPTRRDVLKAGVVGAVVTAFPTIIPASAFGAKDRIVYGHIGVGGMGSSHVVPESCAAVCDVDKDHLAGIAKRIKDKNPTANLLLTDDYRRVLERKDIDAVTIGT